MSTAAEIVEHVRAIAAAQQARLEADPEYRQRLKLEQAAADELERSRSVERRRNRLAMAGIPERVIRLLLAGAADTKPLAEARAFVDESDRRTILVIAGGAGCGKTVAVCAAGEGHGMTFVKAHDLARAGAFADEFWKRLRDARLLAIDDLGTEPLDEKGWAISAILDLLDRRYDACAKTLLTTNLPWEKFRARYGADGGRTLDRLREVGAFVQFDGASMRKTHGVG